MFKNKNLVVFLVLLCVTSNAHASCKIPNRLRTDTIVDDIIMFALDNESLSVKLLKSKGFDSYDEYSYASDSYSKSLVQIRKNYKTLGEKYATALRHKLEEKNKAMVNAFAKIMESCDKSHIEDLLTEGVWVALSGKDNAIELELIELNLRAISETMN